MLSIERVFTQGVLKPCMKSDRQRRRVPLRGKVADALRAMPTRLDTPSCSRPRTDQDQARHVLIKALDAALRPRASLTAAYDCRHTFAAWSIRAGVQLFYLCADHGDVRRDDDRTYGHLVPDSEDYLRGLLDTYDAQAAEAVGGRAGVRE